MNTQKQREEMGMRLRKRREEMKLTQSKAAEKLHISDTHYKNIEHGRGSMSLDVLMDVLEVFDLDPTYLMTGKEYISNPILEFYNAIPENKREHMDQAMYYLKKVFQE